jgi:hypothetical protein
MDFGSLALYDWLGVVGNTAMSLIVRMAILIYQLAFTWS